MSDTCHSPNIAGLEIPMDCWTEPFWQATENHQLLLPACADCGRFRWPPGPFCPGCQSQNIRWLPAGSGQVYSFTLVRSNGQQLTDEPQVHAPALIEFPDADGVRLLAAIVDTPLAALAIGKAVVPVWYQAANATVPMFRVLES